MASAHTELSWVKREHGNSEFGKFAANHFQELIAKLSVELAI